MLYLIFCSLVWAFSYGLIKKELSSIPPDFICLLRMLLATCLFLPFLRSKTIPMLDRGKLLAIGAIQYGIMFLCVLRAYHYLPSYLVVIFTALTPLYIQLIDGLWNRRIDIFALTMACGSFLAIYLLLFSTQGSSWPSWQGFFLVQASDLCFAFGQVAYKKIRQSSLATTPDLSLYGWLFLGALGVSCLAYLISAPPTFFPTCTKNQYFVLLYLGAIASGLCFYLWNASVCKTSLATVSVLNNLKIPLGTLVCVCVFQEKADWGPLISSLTLLALCTIACEQHSCRKQKQMTASPIEKQGG